MDIDVVILWVDGLDPAWLRQKREYLPPAEGDSDSANRYRDWGLLPYWFRAIETFAPWVRKVHFVTWAMCLPFWIWMPPSSMWCATMNSSRRSTCPPSVPIPLK